MNKHSLAKTTHGEIGRESSRGCSHPYFYRGGAQDVALFLAC